MNLDEVKRVLEGQLAEEPSDGKRRNIVFWYDEDAEFEYEIDSLDIGNAKLLKLTDSNAFRVKYQLEMEDKESSYLVYSSCAKPTVNENWLLDIEKYSSEFSTEKTVVIMRNLGVKNAELKDVFKKYLKFFGRKERYAKFESYGIGEYTEGRVDIAVLAALCKLSYPSLEDVVKAVMAAEDEGGNKHLENIENYGDIDVVWDLTREKYGCRFEENSVEKLMIMLLASHVESELKKPVPSTWEEILPLKEKKAEAAVFVNHFMNSELDRDDYDRIADRIQKVLKVEEYVVGWDIEDYIYCDTFRVFDKAIIDGLLSHLVDGTGEFEKYQGIINARRTTHWFREYDYQYSALFHAIEFLRLEESLGGAIPSGSPAEMMDRYASEYSQFDYHYRKFTASYRNIEGDGLTGIFEKIENTYVNWYLSELSNKWAIAVEDYFKSEYRIAGVMQQKDFYRDAVRKYVSRGERVFVIISDALRFEAANELVDVLNTQRKGQVEIQYMQGAVPSYTKLGMASLLPNESIELSDKNGVVDFTVDGISAAGTENRGKILSLYEKDSLAITYENLAEMKKTEFKDALRGKKLVYIYHNRIDLTGHASESDLFESVDRSIKELVHMVKKLVDNTSATNIYVTSDHGFICQRTALLESDKLSKGDISSVEDGRRFILVRGDVKTESTFAIPMDYVLGPGSGISAVVPRGMSRFKVRGDSSKFAHDGISLQEIVVPLVKFKNTRKNEFAARKVEVRLTNITRKLTNRITYLEFFQAEKVEGKVIPLRLRIYFEDEDGAVVSNENVIIADSSSEKPELRSFREKFTLKDMKYDKGKTYYLVMEDEDEQVEKIYQRIGFNIDLVIADDFGF